LEALILLIKQFKNIFNLFTGVKEELVMPLNEDFLKRLLGASSPSGFEQPVQRIWREKVKSYLDSAGLGGYKLYSDIHGNSIAVFAPKGKVALKLL